MKPIVYLFSFLSLALSVMAEEYNYFPKDYGILPPSPEVCDLIKIKDFDVDLHQGRPNISFTLCTVKSGDIEVPVTMTYQSGGIRPNQGPSNLGVGWTLSASGVIGRTVCGIPDDVYRSTLSGVGLTGLRYLTTADKTFRNHYINSTAEFDPSDVDNFVRYFMPVAVSGTRYYDGLADMGHDVYNLSAPGLQGTFIADENGDISLSSRQSLLIQPDNKLSPTKYVVKDGMLTEYTFSTIEESQFVYTHGNKLIGATTEDSTLYISSWHLTTIKNLNNDQVTFTYENGGLRKQGSAGVTENYSVNWKFDPVIQRMSSGSSYQTSVPKLVSQITGRGHFVKISYYPQRKASLSRLVKDVTLYYSGNPTKAVKTYTFEYDSSDFLQSVKMNGETIYWFHYCNTNPGDGIDFGGYCNDRDPGRSNVPACPYIASSGADRSVNPLHAKHMSLDTIYYPTGGKTAFEWESHQFGYVNGEEYTGTLNTTTVKETQTYQLCGLKNPSLRKLELASFNVIPGNQYALDVSKYFELDPTLLRGTGYYSTHDVDGLNVDYPRVTFTRQNSTDSPLIVYIDANTALRQGSDGNLSLPLATGTYKVSLEYPTDFDLYPGYKVDTYFGTECTSGGKVYIREYTKQSTGSNAEYWPGLRIKSIKSYTDNTTIGVEKQFLYNPRNNTKSSGVVQQLPDFCSQYYYVSNYDEEVKGNGYFTQVYTMSENGLMSTVLGDPQIEYSMVGVRVVDPGLSTSDNLDLNTVWYSYSTAKDAANRDSLIHAPFWNFQSVAERRPTSRGHRRGLQTDVTMVDYRTGFFKNTTSEYEIMENADRPLFTTGLFVVGDYTNSGSGSEFLHPSMGYSIGKYNLIEYDSRIKSQTNVEGGYSSTTTYNYYTSSDEYSAELDRDLVKSIVTTFPGSTRVSKYYSYIQRKGHYLPLHETEVELEGQVVVGARRYEYQPNTTRLAKTYTQNSSSMRFSEALYTGKSAGQTLTDSLSRVEYSYDYYPNGCLREITYRGHVLASYIWDDEWVHPVIEGKYISYAKLSAMAGPLKIFTTDLIRSRFKGVDVTFLEWEPLVGIITQYDTRGVATRYTYDSQGRLTTVADMNNFLINRYLYHY